MSAEVLAFNRPDIGDEAPAAPAVIAASGLPPEYVLTEEGIHEFSENDKDTDAVLICSPMKVRAVFADISGKGWGKLIAIRNCDGTWHDIAVTSAELTRSPGDVVARLVDLGLELGIDRKANARLITLLKRWKPDERLTTVDHSGWVDDSHKSFVIGAETVGVSNILPRVRFGSGLACHLASVGSIAEWQKEIGALCRATR